MTRRLRGFAVALATLPFVTAAAPDAIKVDGGQISGTSASGVRIFKGIPFAALPRHAVQIKNHLLKAPLDFVEGFQQRRQTSQ